MKIRWLRDAINDLQAVRQYIAQDNPKAANRLAQRLINYMALLAEQPGLGRQGRVVGTRELIIAGTPYLIPYRVKNNSIEILRLFHSSMQWPEALSITQDHAI